MDDDWNQITQTFQSLYPFETKTKAGEKMDKARDFLNWLMNPKPLKEIGNAEKGRTTTTTTMRPISGVVVDSGVANSGKVIAPATEKGPEDLHGLSSE